MTSDQTGGRIPGAKRHRGGLLEAPVFVPGKGTIRFGDCTKEDALAAADYIERSGQSREHRAAWDAIERRLAAGDAG